MPVLLSRNYFAFVKEQEWCRLGSYKAEGRGLNTHGIATIEIMPRDYYKPNWWRPSLPLPSSLYQSVLYSVRLIEICFPLPHASSPLPSLSFVNSCVARLHHLYTTDLFSYPSKVAAKWSSTTTSCPTTTSCVHSLPVPPPPSTCS